MRIVAVSDVHLGKPYTKPEYSPEVRDELSGARLRALERCVIEANTRKAELFLIAGDLFDSTHPPRDLQQQAGKILRQFAGSALVIIPGNHDHSDTPDSKLWEGFSAGDRSWVLQQPGVYSLEEFDLPVLVYAAPCTSAHSEHHNLPLDDDTYRNSELLSIGLAHGSISGYTPDVYGRYFPMMPEDLQKLPPLFWVVGHAHVWEPRGERFPWLFFPGTPEPDGFDCSQKGTAWYLETEGQRLSHRELIFPGKYEFTHLPLRAGVQSVEEMIETLRKTEHPMQTLVKLQLSGLMFQDQYRKFHRLLEQEQRNFFFLQVEEAGLTRVPDYEEAIANFPENSFPFRLLHKLKDKPQAFFLAQELLSQGPNDTV